jgi:hypothetical protein
VPARVAHVAQDVRADGEAGPGHLASVRGSRASISSDGPTFFPGRRRRDGRA